MLPTCHYVQYMQSLYGRFLAAVMPQTLPIRLPFPFQQFITTSPSHPLAKHIHASPRLKNTLLPPRLPLLLPRRLAISKRKPTRPLIRARRLAHPPRILSKQQRPRAKTEQHSVAHESGRESKAPAAHQLRVQVKSGYGLECHSDGSSRFPQLIARCRARAPRRGAVVFAAAAAFLVFAAARRGRRRRRRRGRGFGCLRPNGNDACEDQVGGCEGEQGEA